MKTNGLLFARCLCSIRSSVCTQTNGDDIESASTETMTILWWTRICYRIHVFRRQTKFDDKWYEWSDLWILSASIHPFLAAIQKQNINFNVCRSDSTLLLCKNWATQNDNTYLSCEYVIYWFFSTFRWHEIASAMSSYKYKYQYEYD